MSRFVITKSDKPVTKHNKGRFKVAIWSGSRQVWGTELLMTRAGIRTAIRVARNLGSAKVIDRTKGKK